MNKKLWIGALLLACGPAAFAQQLSNSGFTAWKSASDSTFQTQTNSLAIRPGVEPESWNGSNIKQVINITQCCTQGQDGDTATFVKLKNYNSFLLGKNVIPGYMTLATPWVFVGGDNLSGMLALADKGDGGSFGSIAFSYKPDSIKVRYRKPSATGENGHIIAYLWNGTFLAQVPSHAIDSTKEYDKYMQLDDVDRAVLGRVESTGDGKLIAQCDYIVKDGQTEWAEVSIPLNYTEEFGNEEPTKLNVIFSAGDYWTRSNLKKNTELNVDSVSFVYNSELATLTYNGQSLLKAGQTAYDLSGQAYDASKLSATANGRGATIEQHYDPFTGLLMLTVKGNDWSRGNRNEHAYTVQFTRPEVLKSVRINGAVFDDFDPSTTTYTLPYAYAPGIVVEAEPEEGFEVVGDTISSAIVLPAFFNNENKTLTLKVADSTGVQTAYVFRFTDAVEGPASGSYAGALSVALTSSINGVTVPMPMANNAIEITTNSNQTVNLAIKNFSFMGLNVGDIFASNLPVTDGAILDTIPVRLTAFNADGSVNADAFGWSLGALPIRIEAQLLDTTAKQAQASIDILTASNPMLAMMFKNIHVDAVPFQVVAATDSTAGTGRAVYTSLAVKGRVTKDATRFLQINNSYEEGGKQYDLPMTALDLTAAELDADVTLADLQQGAPAANNTLYYLPEGSKLSGTNVVVGNVAEQLVLTDSVDFGATKAFTAKSATFNRTTGDELTTFVLPFAVSADSLNGTAYAFEGIKGEEINFTTATTIEANTPYLFQPAGTTLLKGAVEKADVAAMSAQPAVSADDATFFGTYTTLSLESADGETYYSCQDTAFVQAEELQVVPFAAALRLSSDVEAQTLLVCIDGRPTGIINTAAGVSQTTSVYTLSGVCVRKNVPAATALEGLPSGVYIVGGKKVMK